jgi:hypothetical protein
MKTFALLFLASFVSAAEAPLTLPEAKPKYSAVGGASAVPLAMDNAYFRSGAPAYDYWALSSYYVPQRNGASCSSASASAALNALLNARRPRGDEDENITEASLVEKVKGFDWKGLASEEGSAGRHGLTLDQLAAGLKEAFAAYGAADATVSSRAVTEASAAALDSFRRALSGNERGPDDIMLIHFAQDAVTGAAGGPYAHISPIGAYDEKTRRALVFDVDRKWYEPYWASDERLLKAMAVKTKHFGHGGWVLIKKQPDPAAAVR